MAKEFTILNLEHWIGSLDQAIFFHTSELAHHDSKSEGAETIQNELNKNIRSKEIAEFTIQFLKEKERCCGKCGGGFFEDGSVDGLCVGDECLPIKSTDIRHCFVPPKQIKKEEPNEPPRSSDKELRVPIYLTPCIKYSKATKLEQCYKIRDEIQEVIEAVEARNDEAAIEELFDVMTGCATCLVCQFGLSLSDIQIWSERVHEKNERRGYHEGGESFERESALLVKEWEEVVKT